MKMYKKIISFIIAFVLLLSLIYMGGDIKKVEAASGVYEAIQYGDSQTGNWGYILVPKNVSGSLQTGFVVHGLLGEDSAVKTVTEALKKWGDNVSPMILVVPMLTYTKSSTATIDKFSKYVYDASKSKSDMQSVVDQMRNGDFNAIISKKGYKCSIDTDKPFFVTGWSLGGSVAAYAGCYYRDDFPYVGILSPAPSTFESFLNASPEVKSMSVKDYKYSKADNSILMMAASVGESNEDIYHVMTAFYPYHARGDFKYYAVEYADHNNRLFMLELFTFLYAVSHDGTYPTNDMISGMHGTMTIQNKAYATKFVSFPDEANLSDQHYRHFKNGKCTVCLKTKENSGTKPTPTPTSKPTPSPQPEFTVKKKTADPLTVTYKDPYTLEVTATGQNLSYEWQYRPMGETTWKKSDHSVNAPSLTHPSAVRDVEYQCVVKSGNVTKTSGIFKVYVRPKVTGIKTNLADNKVEEGKNFSITVTVEGEELKYQWECSTDDSNWNEISGANTDTYTAVGDKNIKKMYYRCKVTSVSQTVASESVPITVESTSKNTGIPVIKSVTPSVSDNTVDMGQYYTITVKATGDDLSYQWMWRTDEDGWALSKCPGSNDATIQLEGKRPVVYYKCVVSNASGSVETDEMPIYLAKPVLTASVANNTVKKGEKYTISSNVKYDKRFTYKWTYNKHDDKGWKESQIDGCKKSDTLNLEGKNPVITYKLTIIYKDGSNEFSVTSDEITITMAK